MSQFGAAQEELRSAECKWTVEDRKIVHYLVHSTGNEITHAVIGGECGCQLKSCLLGQGGGWRVEEKMGRRSEEAKYPLWNTNTAHSQNKSINFFYCVHYFQVESNVCVLGNILTIDCFIIPPTLPCSVQLA